MERRSVLSLLALLCAALASGALLYRSREAPAPTVETPRLGIGYYAQDAKLRGTGDDGHILYRISAATIVQEPADGQVQLNNVAVDYDPATDAPWRLTAAQGSIAEGGKMIALSGDVVAATHNVRHEGRQEGRQEVDNPAALSATIRTDYLELDPATRIAATDRKVVIEYAGSTIQAIGLRAMLRDDRLELLSAVTGTYAR